MTRSVLLFALVGCASGYTPPAEAIDIDPAPEPEKVAFRAAAREGEARAAIASFPKKDWPCAERGKNLRDEVVTRRLHHADRASCVVPAVRMQFTHGGCPRDATYDAQGRMLSHQGQTYVWGKAGPVTRDIDDERRWKFGMLGGDVATGSDKSIDEIARIDAYGRVTAVEQVKQRNIVAAGDSVFILPVYGIEVAWSTTLVYEGARIVRLKFHGEHAGDSESELLYDCSALPPEPEPGNAEAAADSTGS